MSDVKACINCHMTLDVDADICCGCGVDNSNKTCWDCMQRIGEECGVTGKEVYSDTEACSSYEES